MLRLEKMQIVGFKSFGDRTEVVFPEGITAVVGPNGCGKSNIGDAINWVLGEQSAKMLRGSHMEDVIFNGSERRKPLGMAEVSLHLSGQNGAPEPHPVVITRRLFRNGESEYLLNGERSRLKDIQDILREARVGAKTYATIEQGRIDQILNAKPKERRLIIEEAAGISGFKQKRRLTEMKLDATQANLLRVNDIVVEVRRQINALKRQAAKARRYARLRDDLRGKESIRFGLRARTQDAELARLRLDEAAARESEAAAAARLGSLEADLAAERQAQEDAARALHEARERLHQIEIRINDEEARIRSARERIAEGDGAAARLEAELGALAERKRTTEEEATRQRAGEDSLRRETQDRSLSLDAKQTELDGVEERLRAVRDEIETLRRGLLESMNRSAEARNRQRAIEDALERSAALRGRRQVERESAHGDRSRFEEEAARLREQEGSEHERVRSAESAHAAAADALAATRAQLASESEEFARAREREQSAAARLRTLEDVGTRFSGVSDGVRVLLQAGPAAGVRTLGVVADFVEASEEVEAVAEMYLQGLLPAVLLESESDARTAAGLLSSQGAGRATFLCGDHPAGAPAVGSGSGRGAYVPAEILSDPRVVGLLRDRIAVKGVNGFLQDRIGDAVVVDRLDSALALHRVFPQADYLSLSGEVVYASGLVAAGGRPAAEHGMLAHTRKIHQARAEQAEGAAIVATTQARCEGTRAEVARLEVALAERRYELEEARRRLVETTLLAQRSGEEARRTGRASEILEEELAALEAEARGLDEALAEARHAVVEAERAHEEGESQAESRLRAAEALDAERRRLSEESSALRADVAVRRQALVAAERDRLRREQELGELAAGIASRSSDAAAARERAEDSRGVVRRTEEELAVHLGSRQEVAEGVAAAEASLATRRDDLARREESQRDVRAELEGARERARATELARARAESDRSYLDELCHQELGCAAEEAARAAGEALAEADAAVVEGEIVELREKIEKIGPVNMMAIDEFTELEQRHGYLLSQKEDLEKSMASLRDTIRRINSSSREQFVRTFEAVRSSYQEIFQVLFGGGRADLRLEEGEDVLECGIEILAQPPGKKLGSVQLMSGGEKAMSAIALLFAIFRHQPSPFCLLDEVDAALDDLNVNRFTRMLREYAGSTQFILITHNKLSMDSANLLYGVTMEEPGVSRLVSLKLD